MASSLSLDVEYFLVGSRIFGNSCSAVSCDFGVLVRTSELTSFSTISSPPGSSRPRADVCFVCLFVSIYLFMFGCSGSLLLSTDSLSSCSKQVLLWVAVCELLIMAASLVDHRLQAHGLQQLQQVDSVVVALGI